MSKQYEVRIRKSSECIVLVDADTSTEAQDAAKLGEYSLLHEDPDDEIEVLTVRRYHE